MQTVFGAFKDLKDAEKAAGALLDHGLQSEDISLVAHEQYREEWEARRTQVNYTPPNQGALETSLGGDPLTEVPYAGPGSAPGVAATGLTEPVVDDLDIEGNPAEYVEGVVHPNRLGDTVYSADRTLSWPAGENIAAGAQRMPGDSGQYEDADEHELKADHGITTTTGADAAKGAAKGAGVGLGVGVLAAVASLFIPGVGLVVGSGALATAIAGAAATTAAGAAAGGVAGYLKDQGVPEDVLVTYNQTLDDGGAILAVTPNAKVSTTEVEAILAKYGATNADAYGEQRFAS